MVMTYQHAKVQGQRSVGSEERVETNGRTDGRRRLHFITCRIDAVGNASYRIILRVKVLHARYVLQLLHEARRVLRTFPTVMHASTLSAQRITVCGDLHGKLNDLLLIFWKVNVFHD